MWAVNCILIHKTPASVSTITYTIRHSERSKSESVGCVRLFGDPMDCSPPGSSAHGILQARILEWAAITFSRGSS